MADSKRFVSLGNSQEEDVVEVRGGGTVTGRSGSSLRNNKERKRSSGWSDTDASPPRKSLRFESENDTKICDAAVEEVEGDEEIITGSYAHVRHNLEQIHSPASASKSLRAANANANGTANTKATTCIEKTKSPPYKLHWLSNKYVDQRRTNDEIHSSIRLSPILTAILDTPPMQRLRGLKQLGAAEYVYVNVNHNRFEHSLGVSYLAEKLCRRIRRNQPSLQCTEKDVLCVQLAGLMHDLGHGPFSHCYEHWICSDYPNHILAHPDQALKISNDDKDNGDSGDPGSSSKDWKHESATIMMIDAVLEHLGLAMDEENLDSPLKQIGDGVNAMSMRVGREPSSSEDDCIDATENCPQEDEYTKRSTVPTHDNGDNQKKINDLAGILTSRDILFVKECIWGTPIPLYVTKFGPGFHGRPHQRQDWLYDIVANRHSGLDVDKIDYYARDQRRALGESGEIDKVMMESAVVAWAPCTDPTNCHRCRQGEGKDSTIFRAANNSLNTSAKAHLCSPEGSGNNQLRYNDLYSSPPDFLTENKKKSASTAQTPDAKLHLMICYPTKLIKPSMEFFKTRFNLHSKIYRHKTIDGVECMVSDILSLANPYFLIPTTTLTSCNDSQRVSLNGTNPYPAVHLSQAMLHPGSYLRLRDAVIDQIAASPIPELDAARKLIYRLWCRNLYKCVVIRVMQPEKHAFDADVWGRSEDFIKQGIFFHKGEHAGDGQKIVLSRYDIIVQKCKIHHGQGADDPLSKMRFLEKEKLNKISIFDYNELPEAIIADKDSYDAQLPRSLMECSIRIYCRDSAKCDLLRHAFEQWWSYIGDEYKDQSTTLSPGVEHNEILFISQEYDENE